MVAHACLLGEASLGRNVRLTTGTTWTMRAVCVINQTPTSGVHELAGLPSFTRLPEPVPSVPATARVGPEVGNELPMLPAGHRISAMEGGPSVSYTPTDWRKW